jgi:hypothetical protein
MAPPGAGDQEPGKGGEKAPAPAEVAKDVLERIQAFKPNLPLLHCLCNKGMRERHWERVSEQVGFDIRPDNHTSLVRFLDMGLAKHVEQLQEISDAATKEYSIEKALASMKAEMSRAGGSLSGGSTAGIRYGRVVNPAGGLAGTAARDYRHLQNR